ncbi:MAG: methionyl-tRNA formyltransferase [Oscillospiraceae bacterium]|jgi:methionyl-tRNA formyltransferase|nr:methionyl-tRNA formyltransferase [Oscillospiraceae bacterium]
MRIVFMGTPEFAVPSLARLLADGHSICAVFTQPDKPKGRKLLLSPPPVKALALKAGLPIEQPVSLRGAQPMEALEHLAPELIVVVAYGKLLPPEVLALPKHGCINIHASLLPKYRGAAPIQWAVLHGETETGVTAMQMDAGLDTGDMLLQARLPIDEEVSAGELQAKLRALGADLLSDSVKRLQAGTLTPQKQEDAHASYAPLLTKALSPMQFSRTARQLHNQVRGLSPWPCAELLFEGRRLRVLKTRLAPEEDFRSEPGKIMREKNRLLLCCGDGKALELLEVQPEGKRVMDAAAFLRGQSKC